MKLFFINCSILLAFLVFSGKCLAVKTAAQILEEIPAELRHHFDFIATNGRPPAGFDKKDRAMLTLLNDCREYSTNFNHKLLQVIREQLDHDCFMENLPDYVIYILDKILTRLHKEQTKPYNYTPNGLEEIIDCLEKGAYYEELFLVSQYPTLSPEFKATITKIQAEYITEMSNSKRAYHSKFMKQNPK